MHDKNKIYVETILATRGEEFTWNGLLTLRVHVPVFVWTEILTHKRLARNASSSRAQKPNRHLAMGHYVPDTFYEDRAGMRVGNELPPHTQESAREIWEKTWQMAQTSVELLFALGVAREQANRLLPTIKMVDGIITATEHAWESFLSLRLTSSADTAMQIFARGVKRELDTATWVYKEEHIPFSSADVMEAAAKIARVSYSGVSLTSDIELANRLITDGHLSPFEHIARYVQEDEAGPSALNSRPEDVSGSGKVWYNLRSMLEIGESW